MTSYVWGTPESLPEPDGREQDWQTADRMPQKPVRPGLLNRPAVGGHSPIPDRACWCFASGAWHVWSDCKAGEHAAITPYECWHPIESRQPEVTLDTGRKAECCGACGAFVWFGPLL